MSAKASLRLFLDANVLVSAAWKEDSRVQDLWKLASVRLVSSEYTLAEAERNLVDQAKRDRLHQLLARTEIIPSGRILLPPELDLPKKDLPVLADALAAEADYLVTGDKQHFGSWYGKRLSGIQVYPPGDLLQLLQSPKSASKL